MATSDAFEAYGKFLAVKRHFESDGYDFIKYNGKVKTNFEKFMERNDKFHFYKLSKKNDLIGYVVANILRKSDMWITDMLDKESDETYKLWLKRVQSLEYNFKMELSKLEGSYKSLVEVVDGQYPKLYTAFQRGQVSMETLIMIDECTGIFDLWNKKISDKVVWPERLKFMQKYKIFLPKRNKKKNTEILKEKFRVEE